MLNNLREENSSEKDFSSVTYGNVVNSDVNRWLCCQGNWKDVHVTFMDLLFLLIEIGLCGDEGFIPLSPYSF